MIYDQTNRVIQMIQVSDVIYKNILLPNNADIATNDLIPCCFFITCFTLPMITFSTEITRCNYDQRHKYVVGIRFAFVHAPNLFIKKNRLRLNAARGIQGVNVCRSWW